jgi:hypothetical protein
MSRARLQAAAAALACALAWGMAPGSAAAAADEDWPLAGRQGRINIVIVPEAQLRDEPAYRRQIERLCVPDQSCFINFYGNSTGAPLAVPLPDAIAGEATVVFRRSLKQGAELFQWSCRFGGEAGRCF